QPFVIENRAGAGGNIGIAAVTGSAPDGYTIGAATIGHFAINQYLYSKMPFDAERDMVPVSLTWELPNVFVVPTDYVPAKTLAEFLAWAKKKGQISFGSPGAGTTPHLSGVMFVKHAGRSCCYPCPVRGRAADDSRHARGRFIFCDRQSRLLRAGHPIRENVRASGDLGAALADFAGRSHHGRGGDQGLCRHIMGCIRGSSGRAPCNRRKAIDGAAEDSG